MDEFIFKSIEYTYAWCNFLVNVLLRTLWFNWEIVWELDLVCFKFVYSIFEFTIVIINLLTYFGLLLI